MKSDHHHFPHYLSWRDPLISNHVLPALLQNEIIVASTDTVPGLLGITTKAAHEKLHSLKGDRGNKPFIVLVKKEHLNNFVDLEYLSSGVLALIRQCWPGPLTIIFRARKQCPAYLISDQGTIALRSPQHEGLQSLLSRIPGLFAPSANRSNHPTPEAIVNVDTALTQSVRYVVRDDKEKSLSSVSTIIDISAITSDNAQSRNNIRIIRHGAYPQEVIERIYEAIYSK